MFFALKYPSKYDSSHKKQKIPASKALRNAILRREVHAKMPAAAHKAAIAFGMVYIPVSLYTAVSDSGISFNQLSADGKSRIQYKKVRADNGQEVSPGEIVKGFQYEKDKYVILTNDEIERMKSQKDKAITILHFCPLESVPAIFFEKTYYVVPEGGGDKAYALLLQAMREERKMAIAKTVIGTKETLVALLPEENGLMAETLHYLEEIKAVPKPLMAPQIAPQELDMAKMLVRTMDRAFEPAMYRDTYRERLMEAIQAKIQGQQIATPREEQNGNVTDLMDAMKAMLAQQGQQTPPPVIPPVYSGMPQ